MRFGRNITDRPDYKALCRLLDVDRRLGPEEKARVRQLLLSATECCCVSLWPGFSPPSCRPVSIRAVL
ncbi:hypothetical protein [Nonomuraea sp. NPDC049784]|uniref:hypothetical protein n=1 Tax=Nonomuraea sp. NPDC049784 TaxID=3154361 RepID=UPI0033C411A0